MKKIFTHAVIVAAITLSTAPSALAQVHIDWGGGADLGTHSIGVLDGLAFTASNEAGPLDWSITSGALPTGLALRADLPPWMTWADISISGVATVPGFYSFRLQVTDGVTVDFRDFTVTITGLALADHWNFPDAFLGHAYTPYALTALNAAGPVTFSAPPAAPGNFYGVPPGMTLSGGVLSGLPTAAGYYNIPITVSDGVHTVIFYRSLAVNTIRIAPGLLVAAQGEAFFGDIEATGGTGTFTYTASWVPDGLSFDSANGDFTGVATYPGRYSIQITATDTNGVSAFRQISLFVVGSQPSLMSVWTGGGRVDCTFGAPCSVTVSANNGGVPPLTWSATGLPAGMGIRFGEGATSSWVNESEGEIWGVPTALGTFESFVTVTDSDGKIATNRLEIHVSPLWVSTFFGEAQLDVAYASQLRVIGGQPFYTATELDGRWPVGMSLDSGTLVLSGTPVETGWFSRRVDLQDTVGNTIRMFLGVFVRGPDTTLQIQTYEDLGFIRDGFFYSQQLLACCVPTQEWSLIGGSLPPGVSLSSTGLLQGTPTTPGTYTFLLQVVDAEYPAVNFARRQFRIVVTPLFVNTSYRLPFGHVGEPYPYPAGGGVQLEVDGGTGSYTWALEPFQPTLPPGLTLSSGGLLSGTPTAVGRFNFNVIVTDSAANSQRGYFEVSIFEAGDFPPIDLFLPQFSPFTLGSSITHSLNATGGSGGYTYSISSGAPAIPGVRLQNGPPLPTYATSSAMLLGVLATPGTFTTSIHVEDSAGNQVDVPFTVTVLPINVLSQSSIPKATLGEPYSFTLVPFGGSGNYQWQVDSFSVLPSGLALNAVTGEIFGTPAASGSFGFTVRLTDLDLPAPNAIWSFHNLTVDPFAITNAGLLPVGTAGTPYNVTFTAPGCGPPCVWSLSGGLPNGLTFASGMLSGTPLQGQNTTLTVSATGAGATVSKVFSLRVLGNPPSALSLSNVSTTMSSRLGGGFATLLSTQGGTPPYSLAVIGGALPAGLSLQLGADVGSFQSPAVMHIAGRAMSAGLHTFTLQATDSLGATATRTVTWNVETHAFEFTNLPLPGTTLAYQQATPYVQPLLVYGGTSSYVWSAPFGMPPGLTLDAFGVVSGIPTNTGFFNVPIRVDDGGAFISRNVNINIAGPTVTNFSFNAQANLGVLSVGGSSTLTLSTSNGVGAVTITPESPLPPGFVLLSGNSLTNPGATPVVSMTPLAAGPFSFTLRAEDSAMPANVAVRTFSGTAVPITAVSTAFADGSVGASYSQKLHVAATNGPVTFSLSPTSVPLPPGLSLSADGVISGIPTSPSSGQSAQILATDALGNTLTVSAFIRVSPLAITNPSILPEASAGVFYEETLSVTGTGGAPVMWTPGGLPGGLSLSSDGVISGTPQGAGSVLNFSVTATTATASVSKRFTIFVRSSTPSLLNFPLQAGQLPDVVVGQSVNHNLSQLSGGTPPYSWAVAPGSTLPSGLQIAGGADLPSSAAPGTASIVGAVHVPGDYTFDLVGSDMSGKTVRRTFRLHVSVIGIPIGTRTPVAGQAFAQQFTGFGGTPPYTFSIAPLSPSQDMLPPGMTLPSSGLWSGVAQSTGGYQFRLTVQDAVGNTFSRNISYQVGSLSGLRVINTNPADQWVGADRTLFLATGAGSNFMWTTVSGTLPPGMALIANDPEFDPGGTVLVGRVNTPDTYVFTLRATDPSNASNFADRQFTYNVSSMQVVAPSPLGQGLWRAEVGLPFSETIRVAGGAPPYTFALSPFVPLPPGLSMSAAGEVAGIPLVTGVFPIGVRVTDSSGDTLTFTLGPSLFVMPTGEAPPLLPSCCLGGSLWDASVGAPYSNALDPTVRGGVPPYSFSLETGSMLPSGMTLLPGGNGVSAFLGGIPTTAGEHEFSLVATDAVGQMLTLTYQRFVSELRISPDSLAAFETGSPVNVQFTAAGGSAPYEFEVPPNSDLPPGLTFTPSGWLSGTPTAPGNFLVWMKVTDNIGRSLGKLYRLAVDNPAGEAPAIRLSRAPLTFTYAQLGGAPPPMGVDVTATNNAALPFTLALTGIPGATLSLTAGTTPATTTLGLDPVALDSAAVGTYAGVLGARAPGATNVYDAVPVVLTVNPAAPCTYSVNPTGGSMSAAGGAGSFSVSTPNHCAWTATTADPWITITAGAGGTGNGAVSFSAAPNGGAAARPGSISVNGAVYSLTQFGSACSFALLPSTLSATAAGGNASIGLSASDSSCAWGASGLDASPASGAGSATINITVPPNPLPGSRVLTATIAGLTLTVNQSGIDCTVSLNPTDSSFGSAGGSGSVAITTAAGCGYSTVPGPSWIAITSGESGTGPGMLEYSVAPNSTTLARTSTITIGGRPFQISQAGLACSATIDTSGLGTPFGSGPATGAIIITTNGSNCSWEASSPAFWAPVSPQAGIGNGTVFVEVGSNATSLAPRSTSLTVAGQTVGITQIGLMCTYALQSSNGAVPPAGGSGTVGVISPSACGWTAVSNDPAWLTITSAGTGGSTNVNFSAAPNTNTTPRAGTLTIAGLAYTVTQPGAACSYSLGSSGASASSAGDGGSFGFSTTTTGCTPAVASFAGWITASSTFAGTSGTVTYAVAPNPSSLVRTGTIQVGNRTFAIIQGGTACAFSLDRYGMVFNHLGGSASVLGSPSLDPAVCTPVNGTTQPTIVTLGVLTGPLANIFTQPYTVTPFSTLTFGVRFAHIIFGGQIFTVKQTSW